MWIVACCNDVHTSGHLMNLTSTIYDIPMSMLSKAFRRSMHTGDWDPEPCEH